MYPLLTTILLTYSSTTTKPTTDKTTLKALKLSDKTTKLTPSKTTVKTRSTTKAPCHSYQFTCPSDKACIHNTWLCDGESDCMDGHDESDEVCRKNTCSKEEFRCGSGKCIESMFKCNGQNDCIDGSDEKNCCKCLKITLGIFSSK